MPSHLASEKSPYLLQHAQNPVDWFPWGEEAFAKARELDRPVFLSVGYSTCHWCHVMAHESFENPEIAGILNAHFVSIKVDREERPDVDRVYMTFVQATTGGGGWPMSVFLTPDLKPFVGGTYFPPQDSHGRPGFATVLRRIADVWKNDRSNVIAQGEQMTGALREYVSGPVETGASPGREILQNGFEQIAQSFDPELGGFGNAPKFPRPVTLNFLLRFHAGAFPKVATEFSRLEARWPRQAGSLSSDALLQLSEMRPFHAGGGGRSPLEMVLFTLRKMAAGGMHDHLGGGFHRYSVDRFWHIPHFEKMLYDQAQLAIAYLDAFQLTCDSLFETTARGILDYVRRDMTGPEGGFYSAEDADSMPPGAHGSGEKSEGAFYIWTKSEIDALLGTGDAEIFDRFYGVEEGGNAPEGSDPLGEFAGKNTLIQRMTSAEAAKFFGKTETAIDRSLSESRRKLLMARNQRPHPHCDDKIITAWNGLMISAFSRGAQVLGEPAYLEAATQAALFAQTQLTRGGALVRSYRQGASNVAGFADDYAFLIQGLLDLYEASFDIAWLKWAATLQAKQDALFYDSVAGGYFGTDGGDPHILLRMKEDYDGAEPSPNSVSALNLLRLARMTGNDALRARAEKTIGSFSRQLRAMPHAMPQMLVALEFSLARPLQIVIAGKPGATDTEALLRELRAHFIPNKIMLLAEGGEGQQWLGEQLPFIKTTGPVEGRAAAYVCEDFTCRLPITDPTELGRLLGILPDMES